MPRPLHPPMPPQMPFLLHAHFFHDAAGRHIGRAAGGVHAMQSQVVETESKDSVYSFGRVAVSLILPVEEIQDLALSEFIGPYSEPAQADQRV